MTRITAWLTGLICCLTSLSMLSSTAATSGNWTALGSGTNEWVTDFANYRGLLIVSGGFTNAGDVPANGVAAWDGSCWSALGPGANGLVEAIVVYKDTLLIAGGRFTMAGGIPANNIAVWNGITWDSLGAGTNNTVSANLVVYGGKLIAGGDFTSAGGVPADHIAAWDGATWSSLGLGVNGPVASLIVYNGKLIVGGDFTYAGGIQANRIAVWDGNSWSALGSGTNDWVTDFAIYHNRLIAAGWFSIAGGSQVNYISEWNGSSWSPIGIGLSSFADRLGIYHCRLIVGGGFHDADGVTANHIVAWDGSTWESLGAGTWGEQPDGWVDALTVYNGQLIVGGHFHEAGGISAYHLAAWTDNAVCPAGQVEVDVKPGSCPNPLSVMTESGEWIQSEDNSVNDVANTGAAAKVKPSQPVQTRAVVPIAILGTTDFNVSLIVPASIRVMGLPSLRYAYENVAGPIGEGADECACSETGPDGYIDLTFKIDRDDLVAALGEVYDGQIVPLSVTGQLTDGRPFEGQDCVVIIANQQAETGSSDPTAYPNPFNPTTNISFNLPQAGLVQLEVFNIAGQKVATLIDGWMDAGVHSIVWNAGGSASGVYFYRIQAGNVNVTRKMVLLK